MINATFHLKKGIKSYLCHVIARTIDGDETIITYKWYNKYKKHWVYEAIPEWELDYIIRLEEG